MKITRKRLGSEGGDQTQEWYAMRKKAELIDEA